MQIKYSTFIVLILLFFTTKLVFAGGGRVMIDSPSSGTAGGKISVNALIFNTDGQPDGGEKAEFRIRNARSGDSCVTTNNISDSSGKIYGECFASQAGSYTIYVTLINADYTSSDYILTFVAPTAAPAATYNSNQQAVQNPTHPPIKVSPTQTYRSQISSVISPTYIPETIPPINNTSSVSPTDDVTHPNFFITIWKSLVGIFKSLF